MTFCGHCLLLTQSGHGDCAGKCLLLTRGGTVKFGLGLSLRQFQIPRNKQFNLSSRKFVCDKQVTIQAKKELSLLTKIGKFSKPGACLFLKHAFPSHCERCHYAQRGLCKRVVLVFGIEHWDHFTLTDCETSLANLPRQAAGQCGVYKMFIPR